MDGLWKQWTEWTPCPLTSCGEATIFRTRDCVPSTSGVTDGCEVFDFQLDEKQCSIACPINGNWGLWGAYEPCTVTCGAGVQTKRRSCNAPAPAHNGNPCDGADTSSKSCNMEACAVNGNWGQWGSYEPCDVTCGTGAQIKTRICNDPAPSENGNPCEGEDITVKSCDMEECAVNGNWGQWGSYEPCTVTCGAGVQMKTRFCNDPAPSENGNPCNGEDTIVKSCDMEECAVNGNWGPWGSYGECSVTCGTGMQTKTRSCNDPSPANNGNPCDGLGTSSKSCTMEACKATVENIVFDTKDFTRGSWLIRCYPHGVSNKLTMNGDSLQRVGIIAIADVFELILS
ncbi:HMCN [Mytilus coruscus]|uniref:HMCN n=1 Tax=Mytilus coruscus TaxID=42192 RepID=A0A6J8E2P8_MYTCO|nr:HMCN [Mytilus coruscus]